MTKAVEKVLDDGKEFYNDDRDETGRRERGEQGRSLDKGLWISTGQFSKTKFKVGDHVRVEIKQKTFEKGYEPNFDNELYVITTVLREDPNLHSLKDPDDGEDILGNLNKYGNSGDAYFDRPEGGDEAEGGEDETIIDEDDFIDHLNQTADKLDEAKTSTFRDENREDKYEKRKRRTDELRTYGKFDTIRGEFVRRLLGSEYRIDLNDGENSKEFIDHLDSTKHERKFNGTVVGYIGTNGAYRMSESGIER
ncbi:Hypothetical predicted protein [Paramuricea clavata]|uniref:Uncharacterized protein n=1 Tax=Paramuricea clavata TaxID=317549 RepID=A0A7D9KZY6_PARCT|nr:Hypothetical predicted protein [Paramuricea clavata]